jgi:hypothetical protein
MTEPLFAASAVKRAIAALRADLIHEDGPRISTMRNYRFAIVAYPPDQELALRHEVRRLGQDLIDAGWVVLSISLHRLLLDRLRALGREQMDWIIDSEREFSAFDIERALTYLKDEVAPLIEGPDGLAADCARILAAHVAAHPDKADRTLVLIGRAGALFPFFRSSALLRHLDGQTGNVPVVLLYPGERRGPTGLSFMGVHDPDHDYRPRIYA